MKKIGCLALLCCLLCLCALPALAQEESLPVIRITYAADAILSQTKPVDAQISLTVSGQEQLFDGQLRLNAATSDAVENVLPQKSLRIDGETEHFILYNDGNDGANAKIISAVCCNLIAQSPIATPVRAQEPVVVYLNGEYQGLYTRREIIENAIARFEGLDDSAALCVANSSKNAVCGDVSGLEEALLNAQTLDLSSEAGRQQLDALVDTDSLLNWMAVNSYFGNANLYGELFLYQVDNGPWKFATGDFAYAFSAAKDNSIARLTQSSAAQASPEIAALAGTMLKEPVYREAFLTKLGALYQALPVALMQEAVDAENARIAAELPAHMERWAVLFAQAINDAYAYPAASAEEGLLFQQYRVYRLRDKTLPQRPWYVYDSVQRELQLSDADMTRYFGEKPQLPEVAADTWEDFKAANP